MNKDTFKKLDRLRVEIAGNAFRAQTLFKTIMNYEAGREIIALSELGENACKQIRKSGEELEFALEKIKKL